MDTAATSVVTFAGPADFWADQVNFDDRVVSRREIADDLIAAGFSLEDAVGIIIDKQRELPVVTPSASKAKAN